MDKIVKQFKLQAQQQQIVTDMEISIKLKFLESLSDNKSLEILRVMTKGDLQKQKQDQLRSGLEKIEKGSKDDYLTSRRDYNTPRGCDTPRQAVTHRGGKSKEFQKNSLNKHYISTKNSCGFSKGKKSVQKNREKEKKGEKERQRDGRQHHTSKNKQSQPVYTGLFNGQDGKRILRLYSSYINQYQKQQLTTQKQVFYIGKNQNKYSRGDDKDGNYIWEKQDHIGFRYELIERLGGGSFGEVIKAFDHKAKDHVAIKIIKSNKEHFQLALNQIKILTLIKESDLNGEKNCIRIKDFLVFRKHMCIVFELLSISLLDLLKVNNFQQMKIEFIRRFAIQIFSALAFLKQKSIIHSDIKPQNILLKTRTRTGIKIIDFGTSILDSDEHYSYVQSRYYRAPEVILGYQYSYPIDMWSVGCLLAELYLGVPLFEGGNEKEQLELIMEVLGTPTIEYLQKCKRMDEFFHSDFTPKFDENIRKIKRRHLNDVLKDREFAEFLEEIFVWETDKRLTPIEALLHPWILDYLPKEIRQQHILSFQPEQKQQRKRNSVVKEQKELKTARRKSNSKTKRNIVKQSYPALKSHRDSIEQKIKARYQYDT